jgi:N-acetylmuramoyl-L-alanine amidase
MRIWYKLSSISILLVVLLFALSVRSSPSVLVNQDGKNRHVPTTEFEGLEYVSVKDISSALNAQVYWHRMLRKVTLELDEHQIVFAWFSPYMLYDSEVYNLGYDTKPKDGTLWVPLKGFQRIWNLIHSPQTYQEPPDAAPVEVRILDLKVEEKVNGILVEIFTGRPVEYEVFPDQNRDLNINFYKGRLDTSYFNNKKLPRLVKWIKAFQFENSAQVSLRFRKPFFNFTHSVKSKPDRIQISLIQTPSLSDSSRLFSTQDLNGKQGLPDDLIDVIVIDPGHGGPDSGAVGSKGLLEKEVTLSIAGTLKNMLIKEKGVKVVLTRESDVLVPLEDRTQIANLSGADLFISIHTNASRERSARGCETFFLSSAKTDEARAVAALENSSIRFERQDEAEREIDDLDYILMDLVQSEYLRESQDLAGIVQEHLRQRLSIPSRGVNQAGFVVLNNAYMTAILVETAFISNKKEESLLKKGSFQRKIAQALYESIKEFKERYESAE